jgi:hypothetical protein
MFDKSQLVPLYIDKQVIFSHQDELFNWEVGVSPKLGIRLLSPFRRDRQPGCRFTNKKGIWYFVDNRGHNGIIFFNIIDLVKHKYNFSISQTFNYLRTLLIQNNWYRPKSIIGPSSPKEKNFKCRILVKPSSWKDDNYFSNYYGLPKGYLNKFPIYPVDKYWTNTNKKTALRFNLFYNPKKIETFSYYFPSKNIKLYFPKQEYRFHTNGDVNDIFPIISDTKDLFIVSSIKDGLVFNYYTGHSTVSLFNEQSSGNISTDLKKLMYNFDNVNILLDNDEAGFKSANYLKQMLNVYKPVNIYALSQRFKDIAENKENNVDRQIIFEKR